MPPSICRTQELGSCSWGRSWLSASSRYPPRGLTRNLVSFAGLLCILFAAFHYTDHTRFPGASALPPCLGAALIIIAGASGSSVVGRILSTGPIVFIGFISYSFYLWHWPLLVINNFEYFPGFHLSKPWLFRSHVCRRSSLLALCGTTIPFRAPQASARGLFLQLVLGLRCSQRSVSGQSRRMASPLASPRPNSTWRDLPRVGQLMRIGVRGVLRRWKAPSNLTVSQRHPTVRITFSSVTVKRPTCGTGCPPSFQNSISLRPLDRTASLFSVAGKVVIHSARNLWAPCSTASFRLIP